MIGSSHGYHDDAKRVGYKPSTPGDWSPVPSTVADALDQAIGSGGGGGTPGGSNTQVQYNNAGAFGGITGATTNGTALTLTAPVLGTPASGTLTNCTGLPTSGLLDEAVTYAKMQHVSATDKVLGRSSSGAGDVEEITCTSAARSVLDDTTTAAMLTTLGAAAIYTHPPLLPDRINPDTSGEVFDNVHYDGTTPWPGMGVSGATALTGDRTWFTYFRTPKVLPAGSCKLVLVCVAAVAGSHAYKVQPKWCNIANGERVDKTRGNDEGVQTINVTTSEANDEVVTKIDLDAGTLNADETLAVNLVFVDSGFTVTVTSTWRAFVIWE